MTKFFDDGQSQSIHTTYGEFRRAFGAGLANGRDGWPAWPGIQYFAGFLPFPWAAQGFSMPWKPGTLVTKRFDILVPATGNSFHWYISEPTPEADQRFNLTYGTEAREISFGLTTKGQTTLERVWKDQEPWRAYVQMFAHLYLYVQDTTTKSFWAMDFRLQMFGGPIETVTV